MSLFCVGDLSQVEKKIRTSKHSSSNFHVWRKFVANSSKRPLTSDSKKFALKLKSLLESVAKNISPRFDSFWKKKFYFALTFISFELSLKPVVLI